MKWPFVLLLLMTSVASASPPKRTVRVWIDPDHKVSANIIMRGKDEVWVRPSGEEYPVTPYLVGWLNARWERCTGWFYPWELERVEESK